MWEPPGQEAPPTPRDGSLRPEISAAATLSAFARLSASAAAALLAQGSRNGWRARCPAPPPYRHHWLHSTCPANIQPSASPVPLARLYLAAGGVGCWGGEGPQWSQSTYVDQSSLFQRVQRLPQCGVVLSTNTHVSFLGESVKGIKWLKKCYQTNIGIMSVFLFLFF